MFKGVGAGAARGFSASNPVCEPETCGGGDKENNGDVFDVDANQCPQKGEIKE